MDARKILIGGSCRASEVAATALGRQGYTVDQVADPRLAVERLLPHGHELVVLGDACASVRLRLCAAFRRRCSDLPILLLGAEPKEVEMVGHPEGPDDFVARELDEAEVRARVRGVLRRRAMGDPGRVEAPLACGPLLLDPGRRRAGLGDRWVELTATEYKLLSHLARSGGRAISREGLLRAVWGYEHNGYSHTLTTHVNRLRSKLEQKLGVPRVIETVRGLGYCVARPRT